MVYSFLHIVYDIYRCYTGQLPAHAIPLFRHVVFPVRCDAVQHILQTVKLVVVKHPDGTDGYLLRGNPAVGDVVLAHRAVTVRMDGAEVGIDRIRLFF